MLLDISQSSLGEITTQAPKVAQLAQGISIPLCGLPLFLSQVSCGPAILLSPLPRGHGRRFSFTHSPECCAAFSLTALELPGQQLRLMIAFRKAGDGPRPQPVAGHLHCAGKGAAALFSWWADLAQRLNAVFLPMCSSLPLPLSPL